MFAALIVAAGCSELSHSYFCSRCCAHISAQRIWKIIRNSIPYLVLASLTLLISCRDYFSNRIRISTESSQFLSCSEGPFIERVGNRLCSFWSFGWIEKKEKKSEWRRKAENLSTQRLIMFRSYYVRKMGKQTGAIPERRSGTANSNSLRRTKTWKINPILFSNWFEATLHRLLHCDFGTESETVEGKRHKVVLWTLLNRFEVQNHRRALNAAHNEHFPIAPSDRARSVLNEWNEKGS